ncbi:MAG: ABC transporter permease, partial [Clostridiales bacterium]|nr:ABC transporter permease [Clostridiales bacterium]
MYAIFNAMKNLVRNLGRNILLASVTLAVIICVSAALAIGNTSEKMIEDTRLQIGSKVSISLDLMATHEQGQGPDNLASIGIEDYLSYGESDYLDKSVFSVQIPMYSSTVFAVDDETKGQKEWQNQDGSVAKAPTLMLVGNSDAETLSEFANGEREILPGGKMPEELNECAISSDLAELNNISVGDPISIQGQSQSAPNYELIVSGIYSDKTAAYASPMYQFQGLVHLGQRNQVIATYDAVMSKGYETDEGIDFQSQYYLKDPRELDKFEAEVRSKGLPRDYSVSINQEELDKVTGPLAGMRGASSTFMAVILILGGLALALISYLAVKERKYEIGALRAMGMEKAMISLCLLTESVAITIVCLALGLFAGRAVSQPIADSLLAGQVSASQAQSAGGGGKILMANGKTQTSGVNSYTPISEIEVALNAGTMAQIAVLALALALLSGMVGIVSIAKYEPLKILRER